LQSTVLILTICFVSCKQNGQDYFKTSNGKQIDISELDNFLQTRIDSMQIPGLSIAIIENAEIKYHRALGLKNLDTKEEVDSNTLFEAASLSKPLFAYFVMKQVDKGLLNLDTPLCEYVKYPHIDHDFRYKIITARQVLSHQTGFPNWRIEKKLNIEFDPGTNFKYSGEGYQYLAAAIAKLNNIEEGKLDSIFQIEVGANRSTLSIL